MKPARKRKIILLLVMLSIVSVACALVLYALRQNINLFYTPTEIATGQVPHQLHRIRVGGMVVPGSIQRGTRDLSVRFAITDFKHTVEVAYRGILPDLFREGQGIVALGSLIDAHHVMATEVLAKHDEKYMPPEVKSALEAGAS